MAPSINEIVLELTGGIHNSWPRKGQLSASMLSVKYAILHMIGLTNWIPSIHESIVSPQLAHLLFQLGTEVYVDFGSFIYEQIMRHTDSFAIKLLISFLRLICGLLLSQHLEIVTDKDQPDQKI